MVLLLRECVARDTNKFQKVCSCPGASIRVFQTLIWMGMQEQAMEPEYIAWHLTVLDIKGLEVQVIQPDEGKSVFYVKAIHKCCHEV